MDKLDTKIESIISTRGQIKEYIHKLDLFFYKRRLLLNFIIIVLSLAFISILSYILFLPYLISFHLSKTFLSIYLGGSALFLIYSLPNYFLRYSYPYYLRAKELKKELENELRMIDILYHELQEDFGNNISMQELTRENMPLLS